MDQIHTRSVREYYLIVAFNRATNSYAYWSKNKFNQDQTRWIDFIPNTYVVHGDGPSTPDFNDEFSKSEITCAYYCKMYATDIDTNTIRFVKVRHETKDSMDMID